MNITSNFLNLFRQNNDKADPKQSFYSTLYPESVRYALSHNSARLGKADLLALVHNFTYEAVYLVVKAVAYDRDVQRQYIEDLTKLYSQRYQRDELRTFLRDQIDQLPDDTLVKGTKLAQISRYGSDYWQTAFHDLIEGCVAEDPEAIPRIVAHTPFLAYQHFVDIYKDHGSGQFSIIVPEWMIDKDNPYMGYRVTLCPEVEVLIQEKSICLHGNWDCFGADCTVETQLCKRSYFIDDTINTGRTSDKVTNFWSSEYGVQVPDEKIRVITDLRNREIAD